MIYRLQDDARARVITRSIIRLCTHLRIDVIATGVETQDQLDILLRANCPQVQGYGLARPMPLHDLYSWLRAHTPLTTPIMVQDVRRNDPGGGGYTPLDPAPPAKAHPSDTSV
jgi:predicted signal transduction protein with EAL and GGDEF domain